MIITVSNTEKLTVAYSRKYIVDQWGTFRNYLLMSTSIEWVTKVFVILHFDISRLSYFPSSNKLENYLKITEPPSI